MAFLMKKISKKKFFVLVLSAIIAISSISSFFYSYKLSNLGNDLRNRIVGSRLLLTDYSPYYYRWQQGHDIKLLDPFDTVKLRKVNGCTIPPSMLLLYLPIAKINDYKVITKVWFFIEYLSIIYMFFLFFRKTKGFYKKSLLFSAVFFFTIISSWHYHVSSGQLYILYPVFLTITYQVYSSKLKNKSIITGILLSIFSFLRFPFALSFIPFLFNKNKKVLIGGFYGFLLSIVILTSFTKMSHWQDFFKAMKDWDKWNMEYLDITMKNTPIDEKNAHYPYPKKMEGVNTIKTSPKIYSTDYSIQHLVKFFFDYVIDAKILILSFFMFSSMILFLLRKKIMDLNDVEIFLFAAFLIIFSEEFFPARRLNYYFIEWIFPISLLISNLKNNIKSIYCSALILIGFFLYINLFERTILLLAAEFCFGLSTLLFIGLKSQKKVALFRNPI
jgi:hypothetical protein